MTSLEELVSMGYPRIQAKRALDIAGGDVEQAVGYLLMSERSQSQLGDTASHDDDDDHVVTSSEVAVGQLIDIGDSTTTTTTTIHNHTDNSATANLLPPQDSGSYSVDDSRMMELLQMGYSVPAAQDALMVADGDVNQAINYLLMDESRSGFHLDQQQQQQQDDDEAADVAMAILLQEEELYDTRALSPPSSGNYHPNNNNNNANRPESSMYHSTGIRRDVDVPRMVATEAYLKTDGAGPFCACMAASKFLSGGVVTADFLNTILAGGIELFRKSNSQEWDVGTILKKYGKSNLNIEAIIDDDEPKSCVYLPNDLNQTLGIRKQIALCRNQQGAGWQVLILEIPNMESICIALPPKGTKNKFWYLDFLPRTCFRVEGAHARVHTTLLQLSESLETLFQGVVASTQKEYQSFTIYMIKKLRR